MNAVGYFEGFTHDQVVIIAVHGYGISQVYE